MNRYCISLTFFLIFFCNVQSLRAQTNITGKIYVAQKAIAFATVMLSKDKTVITDSLGNYTINDVANGNYTLTISAIGYVSFTKRIIIKNNKQLNVDINLQPLTGELNNVVVTGTLKAVSRSQSPVPVEVYTPKFFLKNASPTLFESIGMINGVRPQINCNVCNTGDIRINGMPGPYTMVLIDGMPIVSSLSTVYGLNGIPNSLVERIEVVKGPASSLYGSEAMGGIINIITKNPVKAPLVSADISSTTYGEYNADVSMKYKLNKTQALLGINYFNFQNRIDKNNDGFTDVTLQNRISIFNKYDFERKENRTASIAARYVYEDRWGGQMSWNKTFRGGDSIYAESIYTKRFELIGAYQLPIKEKVTVQFSYNSHDQNSYYGFTPYMGKQNTSFVQAYWNKNLSKKHDLLVGTSFRYVYYDDNTPATASKDGLTNNPSKTNLPGVFLQDEWSMSTKHKLLFGYRYDYNKLHGNIHSPRVAYKWSPNNNNTLRASFGTGFRVVNVFTEDHAALTGAREVIIKEELKPERSYNANLNYVFKLPINNLFINIDATAFYSYFTNKITGDFDTNPEQIIYKNLNGHAISQGIAINTDFTFSFPLKLSIGGSYMDVFQKEKTTNNSFKKTRQLYSPVWSGTFSASYDLPKDFDIDITGNFNGPMRLPIFPNDYRSEYSPAFCIVNIQCCKKFKKGWEVYAGIKNIFNFVPNDPIMRPFDPFDKNVNDVISNPNGYTFDPSYNYASLQSTKGYIGLRYNLFK